MFLENLDMDWTLAINSLNCPFTDAMWMFFSNRNIWYPFYAVIAGLMIWRLGWKKGLTMIAATVLTIVCVDQGANIVKDAVARLRPCNDPRMVARGLHMLEPAYAQYAYGFFSAHAGNAIAFALCCVLTFRQDEKFKKYGRAASIGVLTWGLLVGISRIFVGKHFLGDVLVGFAVGLLVAWGWCSLGRRISTLFR